MRDGMKAREAFSYRNDETVPAFDDTRPIVVFDGHCIFCSGWVQFMLRADSRRRFRFIAAQTPLGEALYRHYGLDTREYETNMLLENGRAFIKAAAVLRMCAGLGLPWSLALVLRVIPLVLLDAIYGIVARNRFRIAGRRESCYVPTAEDRARFLS
jgi:predicted DCC family thiol-disulfide oxidoreductase YuxK